MKDKISGFLEVGCNDGHEVVVNHPDLKPDENGVGHIVFSPAQARQLADLLRSNADAAEKSAYQEKERERIAKIPPVDRSARVLTDGSPVTEDHRELGSDGQQKGYVVLSEDERRKGFVRPVRRSYRHVGSPNAKTKGCGAVTTMGQALAETYARDPAFYSGTFCATCSTHFPVGENGEFVWVDDPLQRVGT